MVTFVSKDHVFFIFAVHIYKTNIKFYMVGASNHAEPLPPNIGDHTYLCYQRWRLFIFEVHKKNRRRAWTPGRLSNVASRGRNFCFFVFSSFLSLDGEEMFPFFVFSSFFCCTFFYFLFSSFVFSFVCALKSEILKEKQKEKKNKWLLGDFFFLFLLTLFLR